MYYDAHTHNSQRREGLLSILNVSKDFADTGNEYCSMGLHPWYLTEDPGEFASLSKEASRKNILAIGECGLDKVCATDWALQVRVFSQQVRLANELMKPLIIHCVRAYNELMNILDECQVKVPVIIHGFNKKRELSEQLLAKGYLLSFGAALLNSEIAAATFKAVPPDRLLLETDNSGLPIEDIYNRAAEIRETGIESIILHAGHNFKTVFKI